MLTLDAALGSHLATPAQVREFSLRARARFEKAPLWRGSPTKAVLEAQAAIDERLELLELVDTYREFKKKLGLVEFADQQAQAVELAQSFPAVGATLRQRFRVVLLDEYQDTSSAQAILLRALFSGADTASGRGFPVTAVGDPNQAIYGWRGAAASNILGFPTHFPGATGEPAKEFTLTINRRSGSRILEVGNALAEPLTRNRGGGVELRPGEGAPDNKVGIVQTYKPNSSVKKGEEKGYFLFGGSTCILVFEKDKVVIDKDIIENTQNKIETRIYMGEKFGNEKN